MIVGGLIGGSKDQQVNLFTCINKMYVHTTSQSINSSGSACGEDLTELKEYFALEQQQQQHHQQQNW